MQELKDYVRDKVRGMETARMCGYDENTVLEVCLSRKSYTFPALFPNKDHKTFHDDLAGIIRCFYRRMDKSKITDNPSVLREMNAHEAYLKELCDHFLQIHN